MKCSIRRIGIIALFAHVTSLVASPISIENITRTQPPLHLHVARIDLADPSVSVRVIRHPASQPSGWETTLQLPSDIADRESLRVAVNGDLFWAKSSLELLGRRTPYFIGNPANVCGWAMSGGDVWAHAMGSASLVVLQDGSVQIDKFQRLPDDAREVVSGSAIIVFHGRNVASVEGKNNQFYPRTAAGIDASHRKLVLLVVDGHRPAYSAGMKLSELADEMIRQGCADAINLDGGGSSVMVAKEDGPAKIISRPSDGYDLPFAPSLERPVASVLGIVCATQPSDAKK